jgi:Ca2+-binding EF-hand superfamily protein
LDADRDGRISSGEYVERGAEWQRRQRFDSWDSNRNGIIDSGEWQSAPNLFHRLDANGDSKVSWQEFRADTERYRPPYKWQ